MLKIRSLPVTVALACLIEGLAIYLNMVAHPDSQPGLTIFIVALSTLVMGFGTWYAQKQGILQ
ncbi:MAG: hypothetical protein NTX79_06565 [Candidatus Micrarchaeota archaeon]|nr:hypothetical protein [Candidatus Micrarchaeota archaeon]